MYPAFLSFYVSDIFPVLISSVISIQSLMSFLFRSANTWSIHLKLGLPILLFPRRRSIIPLISFFRSPHGYAPTISVSKPLFTTVLPFTSLSIILHSNPEFIIRYFCCPYIALNTLRSNLSNSAFISCFVIVSAVCIHHQRYYHYIVYVS